MFLDLRVGDLIDPISGRHWDQPRVERELYRRLAYFQARGLSRSDRVFIHYGNTPEFFVDLLAIWNLGGCAVPIDPRLTHFEIETLARAARPSFSLWLGRADAAIDQRLASLGVRLLEAGTDEADGMSPERPAYASKLVSLDAPALILFTSGTTGMPKGVVHTHRTLRARCWTSMASRSCPPCPPYGGWHSKLPGGLDPDH